MIFLNDESEKKIRGIDEIFSTLKVERLKIRALAFRLNLDPRSKMVDALYGNDPHSSVSRCIISYKYHVITFIGDNICILNILKICGR